MIAVLTAVLAVLMTAGCVAESMSPKDLASKFTANTHVYVDEHADPKLGSPDKVNQQVLSTEQILDAQFASGSPLKGIFIANVADDSISPDSLRQALADAHGGFSGAIVVINHKGYFYRAYNVSQGWAANNDDMFRRARDSHRGNLYGTVTTYLANISHIDGAPVFAPVRAPAPAQAAPAKEISQPTPATPKDYTWAWVLFWTFVGVSVIGLGTWVITATARHRRKRAEERAEIQDGLIATETDLSTLSSAVLHPDAPDISQYHGLATTLYGSARDSFDVGDYDRARSYLHQAQRQVSKADRMLHPDLDKIEATPKRKRKLAKIRAVDDSGRKTTVRNDDYRRTRSGGYQHYYPGGVYDGVFFYPGYYPYPFWLYTWSAGDVVVDDRKTVPDQWGGDYLGIFDSYRGQDSSGGYSSILASTPSGGSTSDGGYSGFSDGGSSSHHSSSYSSSDSGSSGYSSSSSSGGSSGFDFGSIGGGFSGGFDSGGGSSGF